MVQISQWTERYKGVRLEKPLQNQVSARKKYISWEATEYPKVCVLGIELDWGVSSKQQPNSPHWIEYPTKGYIP